MRFEKFNLNDEEITIPIVESYSDCLKLVQSDDFRERGVVSSPLATVFRRITPFKSSLLFWLRLSSYKGVLYPICRLMYEFVSRRACVQISPKTKIGYGLNIGHGICMVANLSSTIMIPKIIHYCWFGRNPLPPLALECIASWRKFFPDYEIWQWSEGTLGGNDDVNENDLFDKKLVFDVNIIPYTAEAYEMKKYAFVSDYARFWVLYKYGGIYFDTDVEVIRPMDDIIERGAFMGCETDYQGGLAKRKCSANPGLGLGVAPGLGLIKKMLDYYEGKHFDFKPGGVGQETIVHIATKILYQNGLQNVKGIQCVDGVCIYPSEYFCPINITTKRLHITKNTRSIHRYMDSWGDRKKTWKDRVRGFVPEFVLICFNRIKGFVKR